MKRKQPASSPSPRCDHRVSRELPAWYRRLVILTIREDRDIEPYDFDEDISELGEDEGDSGSDSLGVACECNSEDECECGLLDDDEESEHSYTGSDADYYYELKNQRTDRKIELRDEKERQQEERNFTRELESRKEQEVYAAYEAMLESQKKRDSSRPRLESIAGKTFNLYSVDHVDYCYDDFLYAPKYVEFHYISADGEFCRPPDRDAEILGHVYLNANSVCDFVPFRPPKWAGHQKIQLKAEGSQYGPVFQFINDKYLIMTVRADSEMVLNDIRKSEAADVPDTFKFVGIHMDLEERKRQIREEMEDRRSTRPPSPPSPGDTYFEMSHPMGAWNTG
ncbi:hypothetical protein BBP40_008701 [Aspergillus hancockii]|nr:hypothetical protein BBP40_008701 [Aspergillus hancockii]